MTNVSESLFTWTWDFSGEHDLLLVDEHRQRRAWLTQTTLGRWAWSYRRRDTGDFRTSVRAVLFAAAPPEQFGALEEAACALVRQGDIRA